MNNDGFELIYSYTRKQAIEDGVLIDVSGQAKEVGFKVPTAVSDQLYHEYVVPSKEMERSGQSIEGRLHDLLHLAAICARSRWDGSRVYFDVLFQMEEGPKFEEVHVVAIIGPGDDGNPVMTICKPEDE